MQIPELRDSVLPFPPLAEQRRIAETVDTLLARVEAGRARLDRVPAILKRFRQAVLAAACSGRLTEDWRERMGPLPGLPERLAALDDASGSHRLRRGVPEEVDPPDSVAELELPDSWAFACVATLLRSGALLDVKDGNHGAVHPKSAEFGSTGLPFITAAQVRSYIIDYEGAPKLDGVPLQRLRVGFAEPGDAILTHKGSVGRAALNTRPCVLTPQTTYYRCRDSILLPRYLVYLFTAPQFYRQLAAVMSQTTRDFVPISEQYRLFLILPPVEEQEEIVRRVEALFALADAVERRVAAARAQADALPQAILARAFSGRLVPTEAELARREGRDYEPASVLLERIRRQRGKAASASPRRRGSKIADGQGRLFSS